VGGWKYKGTNIHTLKIYPWCFKWVIQTVLELRATQTNSDGRTYGQMDKGEFVCPHHLWWVIQMCTYYIMILNEPSDHFLYYLPVHRCSNGIIIRQVLSCWILNPFIAGDAYIHRCKGVTFNNHRNYSVNSFKTAKVYVTVLDLFRFISLKYFIIK